MFFNAPFLPSKLIWWDNFGAFIILISFAPFLVFRHKGVVSDVIEGTSLLSVTLDDGKVKSLELGKQGVRFVSQKQKRSRT